MNAMLFNSFIIAITCYCCDYLLFGRKLSLSTYVHEKHFPTYLLRTRYMQGYLKVHGTKI